MPLTIDIKEAQAALTDWLERVIQGEEIIIVRDGAPVARWATVGPRLARRVAGSAKGKVVIAPDFEAPLPDDILDTFGL